MGDVGWEVGPCVGLVVVGAGVGTALQHLFAVHCPSQFLSMSTSQPSGQCAAGKSWHAVDSCVGAGVGSVGAWVGDVGAGVWKLRLRRVAWAALVGASLGAAVGDPVITGTGASLLAHMMVPPQALLLDAALRHCCGELNLRLFVEGFGFAHAPFDTDC